MGIFLNFARLAIFKKCVRAFLEPQRLTLEELRARGGGGGDIGSNSNVQLPVYFSLNVYFILKNVCFFL